MLIPTISNAMPADSFSVSIDLKFTDVLDLRAWDRPFAFTQAILADTTNALLSTEAQYFKQITEIDSTVQVFKFRYVLMDEDWYPPVVFNREQYTRFRLRNDLSSQLLEASLKNLEISQAEGGGDALTIEIPFKIKSKTFNKIFGGDRVRLRISGNITIEGGFRREDQAQVTTVYGQQADYSFHIDQRQSFKITGQIGDKVEVDVDQSSERAFEFENNLKLTYTGYEDEIIQKIEAGNISLQLAGTQLATFSGQNKGLFGLKTELKIGAFELTGIASLEKGEKNKIAITGGAQETSVDIPVNLPSMGRYFFLSKNYREDYNKFTESMLHNAVFHDFQIDANDFYVYKRYTLGSGTLPPDMIYAYSVYSDSSSYELDPTQFYTKEKVDEFRADSTLSDRNFQPGNYVLLNQSQYTFDPQLGYIRLNTPLMSTDVLAVAYILNNGTTFGDLAPAQGDTAILKLISPESPHPDDDTWPLKWQNVYSLQGVSIEKEGFSLKITYNPSGATEQETMEFEGQQQTFLTLFGLDTKNETGGGSPDGLVDDNPALINYSYGELIFPALRPFDPDSGYYVNNSRPSPVNFGDPAKYPDSLRHPSIYDSTQVISTNFSIKAEFKSVQAVYELGFNVLEGSEEVYLGGRLLQRGSDYVIDYYSGRLTVLNQSALSPSASLEILYESGELFQLDKKTLLGVRGEYHLWEDSFIGATALYLNEKPLQDRVRVGNEPLRNFLWDINTRLVFKPKFLTQAVDYIPLVETEAPSEFKVEMEYAQVHPNPNSLGNDGTGDPNGVAYVDDFESIKKTSPLGIMRKQWTISSYPHGEPEGKSRGTFVWFNPYDQVPIEDIWPSRPTNANVAQRTHVMTMYFGPQLADSAYLATKEPEVANSWGGVIRSLSAGYHNQENSEYIEIMLSVRKRNSSYYNPDGKLHIDLGQISEDVLPNGVLDTEDQNIEGLPYGDGFCDRDEDLGLDGLGDPNDFYDFDGDSLHDSNYNDNWYYSPSDPYNVWGINGTEGNYDDEGGRYPDTEDLDRDNFLDTQNNFFRYTIDLSETVPGAQYGLNPGGSWNPNPRFLIDRNENEWKLYRIPLDAGEAIGNPNLTQIEYARVWMDGFADADTFEVSIATLEIVGNEWEAVPDTTGGVATEPLSVEIINTYDNPLYNSPPGVAGYRDPVTDIVAQEQSLLLRMNDIAMDSTGMVVRRLYDYMDFLEYRKLKMFVHGGGVDEVNNGQVFNDTDTEIWMYFRFGSDTTRNYYEYKQRVWANWDSRNNIEIDLAELTSLKIDPDSMEVINDDTIRVVGNPSLSQIRQFTAGVVPVNRNVEKEDNLEIWLDELRLSDVKRDIGRAVRASANLTLADLASFSANVDAKDGDFHNVNTRVGSRSNSISGSATGNFKVDKFLNPQWGLSIPVSGNFSQSESVPYYFPNSDILVDQGNPEHVDSVKTYSRGYGGGISASKSIPSANPILKYTVDNLSGGYDYSYQESSNPTTLLSNTVSHSADMAYALNFGRPSLKYLSWLKGVPVLNKYAEASFFWMLTNMNLSMQGSESVTQTRYRAGNKTFSHTFYLTKSLSTGYRPFESLSFDLSRTHKADMLMNPEKPKDVANILQGDFGWAEDIDVNQTFTAQYNPRLISLLDTDFRYNTSYHWSWGQGYISSAQTITNSNTITASGKLRLTEIFVPPTRQKSEPGQEGESGVAGQQEQQPEPDAGGEAKDGEPEGGEQVGGEEGDPSQSQTGGEEEGVGEDTTRVLATIAKPKGQSFIGDSWYAIRYIFSRLRDVDITYTQQKNWSDPLVEGQAGIGYQFGFDSHAYTRMDSAAFYTGYSTRSRNDDYTFKSGLDFTNNFKISLTYDYGWSRSESASISGDIQQSRLYFFKTGGDSIDVFELPIPDWSVTLSGLEKMPMFENIAQSVSLENSFSGSKSSSWQNSKDNIRQHDFQRNFSPLFGINITWKGGITSSLRYNWTETGTVQFYPTASISRNVQKGAQFSASYTMKTGFKIPIPVWPFKNKRFKNSTTISLAFNYSNTLAEQATESEFVETNATTTWSIKPSLDYTFSNTVTGGMHFEYGANKSKTQDSNFQEFGINVNIAIRG
ncbi:hypothetical protein CEE37_05445 [candidate division LCP-89 bacterium B3_LCP]|uniref:Gliding motility protein SprA N-terminal domain-containing protein n=1 Tax=candidate division LCP-89 bacterium B3_LCP TaxID=2012998 RepID=A0A532V1M5_UNCL8|nr:MAG: hypothetical protein CEE37_05445 [candidate division LCP-89 bacterium B3_LCP]